MTVFHLKIIAILTMVIDHIGLYFFPDILLFRIVGRISFPIFAWLIANGEKHTQNIKRYLIRLFLFACISQPFFYLTYINIDPTFDGLNVLFTLFIGLGAIIALKKIRNKFLALICIVLMAAMAEVIKSDYGAIGILSIVFFYIFYNKMAKMVLSQIFIYTAAYWLSFPFFPSEQFFLSLIQSFIGLTVLFSLFLIMRYKGVEGPRVKHLFYVVYPMQYVVIYLLQKLVY